MSVDVRGLLKGILDFQFLLGLQILKVIFSNTNALAHYLQEKDIDIMTARPTCQGIIETLKKCRYGESIVTCVTIWMNLLEFVKVLCLKSVAIMQTNLCIADMLMCCCFCELQHKLCDMKTLRLTNDLVT